LKGLGSNLGSKVGLEPLADVKTTQIYMHYDPHEHEVAMVNDAFSSAAPVWTTLLPPRKPTPKRGTRASVAQGRARG
jgi:hypothetical protein